MRFHGSGNCVIKGNLIMIFMACYQKRTSSDGVIITNIIIFVFWLVSIQCASISHHNRMLINVETECETCCREDDANLTRLVDVLKHHDS